MCFTLVLHIVAMHQDSFRNFNVDNVVRSNSQELKNRINTKGFCVEMYAQVDQV